MISTLDTFQPPLSGNRWNVLEASDEAANALSRDLGVAPLIARLLIARGYPTAEAAQKFLNPSMDDLHDPKLLPDFDAGCRAILWAKESGKRIFIHGDYDVDGMTSAALLTRFLKRIGCDVVPHVPHRTKEGYGIHQSAVDKAKEHKADLFLTCDCGSSAIAQIEHAVELGMRVVVTDHHALHEKRPNAEAFINPHRTDASYPFAELSGVGVAFKFCAGIARECGLPLSSFYRAYLDLVTLGTVADVMPLIGENRTLVRHGCPRIQESQKPGIKALLELIQTKGKVTARTIGFQIGPRLNAAGRLEDAALSLELLLSEDMAEARQLAQQLDQINTRRREEQQEIVDRVKAWVTDQGLDHKSAIVVGDEGWHPGIIGLVAGKLADAFYRPAFVMHVGADGVAKGSARTIPGYHLADALKRVTHLLKTHGGHELAAGFSIENAQIATLREALENDAAAHILPEHYQRSLTIDATLTPGESTFEAASQLDLLAPFGAANPDPLFLASNLEIERIAPLESKPQSVRMSLRGPDGKSITAMGWDWADRLADVKAGTRVAAIVSLEADTWNGRQSAKWTLKDIALAR